MNRRTHHNHSSRKNQSRIARVQDKLQKLRDRVRRSTALFMERRQARLAWWQIAFRTPLVGFYGWVRSRCTTMWAAMMTILGLSPKTGLFSRGSSIKKSKSYRQSYTRGLLMSEGLEQRQLLAADLYVDSFVDLGSPVVNSPAVWVGADDAVGGGDDKNVTFKPTGPLVAPGLDGAAYDSLQEAIDAATAGDTIYVAAGTYSNIVIDKQLTLLSVAGAASTIINGPNANQGAAIRVAAGVQGVVIGGVVIGGAGQGFTLNAVGLDLAALYLVEDNDGTMVSGNVINGGTAHAVLMGGKQDNVTVNGNTINGDGPTALVYVNGEASLGPGQESTNVDITNNTINGGAGAGLLLGLEGASGDVTGNTFTGTASYAQLEVFGAGNTITGNDFDAAGTPFVDGASNYDEAVIVANNTFASSPIYIQGGAFYPTIQAAITAAVASDTIVVAAGTYVGDLDIPVAKSGLTIEGPFAGVPGTGMSRSLVAGTGEATIEGLIRVSAPGVTLDGLRVLNGANLLGQNVGVYVESTNLTVENSVLYRALAPLDFRAILTVLPPASSDGLTVTDNAIEGWATGLYVQGANNVAVTDNLFEGNNVGMSADSYTGGSANLDVTGNSFVDNLIEGFGIGEAGVAWDTDSDFTGNTFVGPGIFSYSPNLPPSVLGWNVSATVPGTSGDDAFSVVPSTPGFVTVLLGMTPVAQIPNTVKIVLDGGDGNDTFTVDIQAIPSAGLEINGQLPTSGSGDSLVLTNSGADPTLVTHNFTSNSDGSVVIDGAAITYTGLEPVLDNLDAADRVFNFTGGAEDITLGISGPSLIIDSLQGGESVTFTQPTNSLTITGATGDTLSISTAVSVPNVALNVPTVTLSAPITGTVTGNATAATVNAGGQIQDGVDAVVAGSTVNVGAGTFADPVVIANNLTLNGAGPTTIINGASVATGETLGAITVQTGATNVTISNLAIVDSNEHGIRSNNATGSLTVSNVAVSNSDRSGIRTTGALTNVTITNSSFTGNGANGLRIATAAAATVDINGVTSSNNTGGGTVYGIERASNSIMTIRNSVISGNEAGVLISSGATNAVTIVNNDFSGQLLGSKIVNTPAAAVNASRNYWGTVDPTAVLITGTNAALVDFSPMLAAAPVANAATYSAVYVHTLGAQSGATGRIPEGSALVATDGDLNVLPGTYAPATEPVNVAATVNLKPGASPGVVSAGSLNLAASSNLVVEIDGNSNSPTVTFDQLFTTGTVTIGAGVDLIVDFGYLPAPGDSWVLVDNDLADAVSGTFAQGTSFTGVGPAGQLIPLTVNYGGGDSNDIVLSVTSFANVYAGSGLAASVLPAPGLESGVDSAFELTADNDGSMSLTAGDTVSFTAPGQPAVTGLIFGYQAFATVQDAFAGAAATATIHSAGWDLLEDGSPLSIPVTTGSYTVNTFGTFMGFDGSLIINPANTTFTFTPATNENGPEVFNYMLTGGAKSITGTVWIDVTPVNDAPAATLNAGPFVSNEGDGLQTVAGVASGISVGPTNESSQTPSFVLNFVSGPGTLTFATAPAISSAGELTYTPDTDAYGTQLFQVVLNDNGGTDWGGDFSTVIGTITITVNAVNDAPVADDDSYSIDENNVLTISAPGVLGNDSDIDSPSLTTSLVTPPAKGVLTFNTDGSFTFDPNGEFEDLQVGEDEEVTFEYSVSDGFLTDTATVTITVTGYNDAPVAIDDSYSVDEDDVLTIAAPGVLANDTDVESDTLAVAVTVGPTNGSLSLAGDGSFVYTPNAHFHGTDSFTYQVFDGFGGIDTATVTITVDPVDDPIVAVDDLLYSTNEDTPLVVNTFATGVLFNDVNIDNDPLNAVLISPPSNGLVVLNNNGTFTYTPGSNFNGVDSFTYLVSDGVTTDTAVVNITVNAVNDNPVNSVPGAQSTPEDVALVFSAGNGNLISVSDVDVAETLGGEMSVQLTVTNGTVSVVLSGGAVVTGGTNGGTTVTIQGLPADLNATLDGLIYTPDALYNGSATLTVVTNDLGNTGSGGPLSDTDVVNITVTAVNNPPVAAGDSYAVLEDQTLNVTSPGVLSNDSDVDLGDTLTAVLVTGPANGTLTLNANGSFTYEPNDDFFGTDEFVYKANDGTADSADVTVSLTVRPVNDAPVAADDSVSLAEDTPVFIIPVLANDEKGPSPSEDGQTITIVGLAGIPLELSGAFTVIGGTTLQFTPPANYSGTAIISYTIRDNGQSSANANVAPTNDFLESTGFVTVTVTPVSDAPDLTIVDASGDEDTDIPLAITADLTDLSETLSDVTISGVPTGATLSDGTDQGGGVWTVPVASLSGLEITPAQDYNGTFELEVSVESTDSPDAPAPASGTLTVTVAAVNDAPEVSAPVSVNATEDTPYAFGAGAITISDVDLDALNDDITVTLEVPAGHELSATAAGAAMVTGSGTSVVTITGLLADVEDTLDSLEYTPLADFNGSVNMDIEVDDGGSTGSGGAQQGTATVEIVVDAVNDTPVADDQSVTVDEDDSVSITLTGSDTDMDPITFDIVDGPANGTLTGSGSSWTYTPDADFNGTDSFTFTVNDGTVDSSLATVSITVDPINDAPDALDASVGTIENTPTTFDLKDIVSDVETADGDLVFALDPMSFVPNPLVEGTLTVNPNGVWTFVPFAGYVGSFTVQYEVTDDGDGVSLPITVFADLTIVVSPFNDPPVNTVPGDQTTDEDTALVFSTGNGNAISVSDPDVAETVGGELSVTLSVNDGTLLLSGVTGLTFTAGANGDASFTFQGLPLAINNALQGLTYTPDMNFNGDDTLTITTNDLGNTGAPNAQEDIDTVLITVDPVNDAPVGEDDDYGTDADVVINIPAAGVLANDTDAEDDDLEVVEVNGVPANVDTQFTLPSGALLTVNADGSFEYDPNGAFDSLPEGDTDTDTFTYLVNDGTVDAVVETTVTIEITGVNDAPEGTAGTVTTNEDTAITIDVLTLNGVSDVDDPGVGGTVDPTTVTIASGPSNGTVSVNAMTGEVTYTPSSNFNGSDSFTYTVDDDLGLASDPITVNINVTPVNDAPVAVANTYTTAEDTTLTVPVGTGVLVNDNDVDGNPLTAVLVTAATSGTVFLTSNGSFIYVPAPNFTGVATFTYRASDGLLLSNIVTVSINVTAVNDAPVANAQSVTVDEDNSVAITLTGSDIDGDTLTYTVTSGPTNGALSGTGANLTYTPDPDFFGSDSFTFVVNDGTVNSAPATVTIAVSNVQDAPVGVDDSYTTPEGDLLTVLVADGVLDNDIDVDGDPLTVTVDTPPAKGILVLNANGSFTYDPNGEFEDLAVGETEDVTFTYTVTDGTDSATAMVTITITGQNDQPTATGQFLSTDEDVALSGMVTGADTDTTDLLTYHVSLSPSNGTLVLNTDGSFTYTPNANFNGADAFSFIARDDSGALNKDSAPAVVVVTIASINDAPVNTVTASLSTDEDVALPITSISVFDVEAPMVTVQLAVDSGDLAVTLSGAATISAGVNGSDDLTISGSQLDVNNTLASLVFTPDTGFNGNVELTVTTSDLGSSGTGGTLTDVDTVNIEVGAVNNAPVAIDVTLPDTNEDTPVVITAAQLLAGVTDPDGPSLTITSLTVSSGMGNLTGTGPWTFTPNADWNGPVVLDYTVSDGEFTDTAQAMFSVVAVNDAPELTLVQPSGTLLEGQLSDFLSNLITNITDVDAGGGDLRITLTAPAGKAIFEQVGAGPLLSTVTGEGTNELILEGSLTPDQLLADLAHFKLRLIDADPGAAATEAIAVAVLVDDLGNSPSPSATASGTLNFTGVDVAPALSLMDNSLAGVITEATTYELTIGGYADWSFDPITSLQIRWGDGTPNTVLTGLDIAALNTMGGSIMVTHFYADDPAGVNNGVNLQVDVVTQGNALQFNGIGSFSPARSPNLTVNNVNPTVSSAFAPLPLVQGQDGSFHVDASDVAGANDPLTYSYDWDNNGTFDLVTSSSDVTIPASFITTAGPNAQQIRYRVEDGDGGFYESIRNEDVLPVIFFTVDDQTVDEDAGTITVTVTPSSTIPAGVTIPITVNFSDFGATLGSDYAPSGSQTVTFNAGDSAGKTVSLEIIDNAVVEGFEAVAITLSTSYLPGIGQPTVDVSDVALIGITDDDTAFQVAGLKVTSVVGPGVSASTAWKQDFLDAADVDATGVGTGVGYSIPVGNSTQTKTLPWRNINRLIVTMSDDIDGATIDENVNVILHTTNAPGSIAISSISVSGNVMTIDLPGPLLTDSFRLEIQDSVQSTGGVALDGDFTNGSSAYPSGGAAETPDPLNNFNFHFVVQLGNANQTGPTNVNDGSLIFAALNSTTAATAPGKQPYSIFKDITGDGIVNVADSSVVFANINAVAPMTFPGIVQPSSSLLVGEGEGSSSDVPAASPIIVNAPSNTSASAADGLFAGSDALSSAKDEPTVFDEALDEVLFGGIDGLLN